MVSLPRTKATGDEQCQGKLHDTRFAGQLAGTSHGGDCIMPGTVRRVDDPKVSIACGPRCAARYVGRTSKSVQVPANDCALAEA